MATEDEERAFDSNRRLCPDGSCLGVIGDDGKCMVCGADDDGRTAPSTAEQPDVADEVAPPMARDEGRSDFDPNRKLCSDGSCVGVIGNDGRCSLCGKPPEAGDQTELA